jgi:hypothetical protein
VKITSDLNEFDNWQGARINFSQESREGALNIKPHSILFDHGIRDYHLEVNAHPRFHKLFFRNSTASIPFDLFGAAFWLLSRYEEHLPYKGDVHNRFQFRSSLAYQYDFIKLPLVNLWMNELIQLLKDQFPSLQIKTRKYNFISTIDVDNVYKYKNKGFVRSLAGILSEHNLSKIFQRLRIIFNKENDPYDCYEYLIKVHGDIGIRVIFFFLLGDYGLNDKNHSSSDLRFQSLIKHIADYSKVGIHPSFGSNESLKQLKIEVSRLGNITHRLITMSRQHFSMLRFPETYKNMLQAGLTYDYSMGYSNYNGFRASYCYPYKWYSLDIESRSSLNIHPFCLTDTSLRSQSVLLEKSMIDLALPYIQEVQKFGGELISIVHNDHFDDAMKAFYPEFLLKAKHPD